MEQDQLLTVKDLATKWKKDESTIRKQISKGILTPCKVPGDIRFTRQYVAELEGVELERFSPLERKKLEKEIEVLRNTVQRQSELLRQYAAIGIESMKVLQQNIQ